MILSITALALSLYATVDSQLRAAEDKRRTVRSQLTDVLGRLTSLQVEHAKAVRDAAGDQSYLQNMQMALAQQNGFLLDQAVYLSNQIPALVTTYELNTIATATGNAGNFVAAEKFYLRAIKAAESDYYKSLATRSYAAFLYPQRRFEEGRTQFRAAVSLLKGGDNQIRSANGLTYQWWGILERHFALSEQTAKEAFKNARIEFSGIDVEYVRASALHKLDLAEKSPTPLGLFASDTTIQGPSQLAGQSPQRP